MSDSEHFGSDMFRPEPAPIELGPLDIAALMGELEREEREQKREEN